MTRVIEVLYSVNKTMKYGFFKDDKWHDIINAFFIEGNVKIPEKLKSKDLSNLTEKDYAKFFEALDYTVVGISDYNPDIHQHSVIREQSQEREIPEC